MPRQSARRELSFVNLCKLHLLAVIRRHHGIKLAKVRQAIDFLRRELRMPRPLTTQRFLTNGVALFVEHAGELLNLSKQGQQALRDDFVLALARIKFGGHGGPVLLFPFTAAPPDKAATPTLFIDRDR